MDLSELNPQQLGAYKANHVKPLAKVSAEELLARYEAGGHIPDIATELGVSFQAVYAHIFKHDPEGWKEQQAARAIAELEQWEQRIVSAPDTLELTRAREGLRAAQWKLERVLRRIYGQDSPPASVTINITAVDARIEALERELGLLKDTQVIDNEAQEQKD